jgi:hypothetical protein
MTTSNLTVGQITGSASNSGVINLPTGNKIVGADAGSIRTPGNILQVVQGTLVGGVATTSFSFVVTGLQASITPLYSSSKILVMCQATQLGSSSDGGEWAYFRNGSVVFQPGYAPVGLNAYMLYVGALNVWVPTVNMQYLDSPASTSTQTYDVRFRVYNGGTLYMGGNVTTTTNAARHTLTLMEVAN